MIYCLCLESMICMPKDMRTWIAVAGRHVEGNEMSICLLERSYDKTGDRLWLVLHQSQMFLV
jgi:hypothetical protein